MKNYLFILFLRFINQQEILVLILYLNLILDSLVKIAFHNKFDISLTMIIVETLTFMIISLFYFIYFHWQAILLMKLRKYYFDECFHGLLTLITILIFTECNLVDSTAFPLFEGLKIGYILWTFFNKLSEMPTKYFCFIMIFFYLNFRLYDRDHSVINVYLFIAFVMVWLFYLIVTNKVKFLTSKKARIKSDKIFSFKQNEAKPIDDNVFGNEFVMNSKIFRLLLNKTSDCIMFFDQNMNNVFQNTAYIKKIHLSPNKTKVLAFDAKIIKIESPCGVNSPSLETTTKLNNFITDCEFINKTIELETFVRKLMQSKIKPSNLTKEYQLIHRVKAEASNLNLGNKSCEKLKIIILIFENHQNTFLVIFMKDFSIQTQNNESAPIDEQSKILSYVSHEFRTPLNCINGMLQSLEETVSVAVYDQYIQPALSSGRYLMNMIQDILDMTQLKAGKFNLQVIEFDLNLLLKDIFLLFQIQAKIKKINTSFEISPKIPKIIQTDPNRLKQIIINLLSNAFKYTQKGSIRLVCEPYIEFDDAIFQNSNYFNRIIKISVYDTGLGIREEDKNKLLKAFGKIEDEKNKKLNPQGVGLGLIISQEISKALALDLKIPVNEKGLQFSSEYGQGSTFYFLFENHKTDYSNELGDSDRIDESEIESPEFKTRKLNDQEMNNKKKFKHSLDAIQKDITPYFPMSKKKKYLTNNPRITHAPTAKDILCSVTFNEKEKATTKISSFAACPGTLSESHIIKNHSQLTIKNIAPDIKIMNSLSKRASFYSDMSISFSSNSKSVSNGSRMPDIRSKIENFNFQKKCGCPEILICDDDGYNILALQFLLDSLSLNLDTSSSGDEAIQKVKEMYQESNCCKFYRIIFLDIEMPGKNGFETCKEIKQFFKEVFGNQETKIIACTGYNDSETKQKIKEIAFDAHLVKPILKGALMSVLIEYLSEANKLININE